MATIAYGVSGEGPSHSSRTRETASHLHDRGHECFRSTARKRFFVTYVVRAVVFFEEQSYHRMIDCVL